jgi:hypothetical protein
MLELGIIGTIVLAASLFLLRRVWRAVAAARAPKGAGAGCDSGCGCATHTE